jgi:hypothetical protein
VGQGNSARSLSGVPRRVELSFAVPKLRGKGLPEVSKGHATKIPTPTRRDESEGCSEAKVSKAVPSRRTKLAWLIQQVCCSGSTTVFLET